MNKAGTVPSINAIIVSRGTILLGVPGRAGCIGCAEISHQSISAMVGSAWRGGTTQQAAHSREHHRIHDLLAQHGKGGFSGSIGDLYQVALSRDGDIADTPMPCQGPAHIRHSETAQKAINPERGPAQQVGMIGCGVGKHMYLWSYPHIV
jgi:hypothetical protein